MQSTPSTTMTLKIQQPLLAPQASAVTGQAAICSDHPMTGNEDGDAVVSIGTGHRSDSSGVADSFCLLPVGPCFAVRDGLQRGPNLALEIRTGKNER